MTGPWPPGPGPPIKPPVRNDERGPTVQQDSTIHQFQRLKDQEDPGLWYGWATWMGCEKPLLVVSSHEGPASTP